MLLRVLVISRVGITVGPVHIRPTAVRICRLMGNRVTWAVSWGLTFGIVTIGSRTSACTGTKLGSVGEIRASEWTSRGHSLVSRMSTVLFTEPLNKRMGLVKCRCIRVVNILVRVKGLHCLEFVGLSCLKFGRLGVR